MKPTLFEKTATDFSTLGLLRLPDCISCTVTEELNGAFELEMVYPVTGYGFFEILEDRIIAARPSDGASVQAFRIYRITTPMNGQVTVNARHISYQMNFIPVPVVSGSGTALAMMNALSAAALETCPFTFDSDLAPSKSYEIALPGSLRTALGGVEGSVVDTFGGEFEWDNWTVNLVSRRGADNGVRITYGKNLTDIKRSVDIGETITGICGYYKTDSGFVYTSPRVIQNGNGSDYAFQRTVTMDFTSEFQEKPTTAQLTTFVTAYLSKTALAQAAESVDVDFVALWQSPEYIDYAPIERVALGDTVYVSYPQLGISVKKRVTKAIYNVILDRYDKIELGSGASIVDTIAGLSSGLASQENAVSGQANTVSDLLKKTTDMAFVLKETGTISISEKTAVTSTDVNITFAESYDAAPRVLVVGNNTSAAVYGLPCLTANSTTGATVRLRNTAAHRNAATFRWFTVVSL